MRCEEATGVGLYSQGCEKTKELEAREWRLVVYILEQELAN